MRMKPMAYLAVGVAAALWAATAGMAQELRPQARPEMPAVATQAAEATPQIIAALPDAAPAAPPQGPVLGSETNLPLPRYVSLKTGEGNVRRGPSLSHRIDWVFLREDMPLQIIAEYGHWRRVVDSDGVGGWMNYSMLSGNRTVLVQTDQQPIYSRPDAAAPQNAILELGVVAELGECQPDWCWISTGGYRGWAPKTALWGVDPGEVRD
jgi:SH3-like domain-containing protein